jgi:hypothetical protein
MNRGCRAHGRDKNRIQYSNHEVKILLLRPMINEMIILKWIEKWNVKVK